MENKNLEMNEMEQEVEERNDDYTVEDPCTDLEELADREEIVESDGSSGAAWMALGAAIVIGGYVGGKWVYKKAKGFVKKKLDERAAKKQEHVEDYDEETVVDAECKEVEEDSEKKNEKSKK